MAVIVTNHLFKTYKDSISEVHAVEDLNLTIEEGEFTAIVGPSGSGKTTLLNLIGGLDTPTSGELFVDGRDISRLKPREMVDFRLHHIGFVFQAFNLIPVLSAKENVAFVMELQGVGRQERERRAVELLEAVGLGDRADSRPAKLSGGQQQRVAVARALASRPKFILADEPTANLDSQAAGKLLDMMEALNEREQVTFVFSTHDPRIVAKARRVVTLEDGRMIHDERK